jgi:thymidylate synthase
MNILKKADEIINQRSEEKDRQYGPMDKSMDNAAKMASLMSNKTITAIDMFNCMIALKLSRESYSHKEDNLLDAVAYAGALNNYHNNNKYNYKLQIYKDIYDNGKTINPRGEITKELLNYTITFKPYDRFLNFEGRKFNLQYIKDEFNWYLCGNKNDHSILKSAKIWKTLINKDNSINSNYGQYINNNFLQTAAKLMEDENSRRAIIMIGNNAAYNSNTNDHPCTLSMQFLIRDNQLHMTVNMRSNDAIYGLTNDIPAFSFYQEMMYVYLRDNKYPNLQMGNYTHNACSMHIYKRHFKMVEDMLEKYTEIPVECPKISCEEEVCYLLQTSNPLRVKPTNFDNFNFTKWLNNQHYKPNIVK